MRNLVLFFVKNYFTILFILLEGVCFFLAFQYNRYHKANFITNFQEISGTSYKAISNTRQYLQLADINKQLAKENAFLKSKLPSSYASLEPACLYIGDSLFQEKFEFQEAKVINSTRFRLKNHLTINRGYKNAVEPEQGVISSNGIVGIIKDVSKNYATVISLLHTDARFSVKLKNSDYFGILKWDGKEISESVLYDIPTHVDVQLGDTVVSRGANSIFPENILVGTISDIITEEGNPFYQLRIKLSVDFSNIHFVYTIKNKLKAEKDSLELSSWND